MVFEESSIQLVPPTAEHAEIAALARLRYPLNLGDCLEREAARHQRQDLNFSLAHQSFQRHSRGSC